MKRTKTQKGITLIALIITIIVLLILAVVAISAVQNDGIINYAKNARTEYETAEANEQTILGEYLSKIEENIPNENNNEEYTLLFYGTSGDGTKTIGYVKYNNEIYEVIIDNSTEEIESAEIYYTPEGREGTRVKYDSNGDNVLEDWIIITDRDEKVEIVSANAMTDSDGNGLTFISDELYREGGEIEEFVAIYNNAITTINDFCDEIVTATDNEGVRSVGGNIDTEEIVEEDEWWYIGAKKGDMNYVDDLVKMIYFGIESTGTEYWVSSREVIINMKQSSGGSFDGILVRTVNADGYLSLRFVFGTHSYQGVGVILENISLPVRPIVINPSGI